MEVCASSTTTQELLAIHSYVLLSKTLDASLLMVATTT
jgi:hypothetical protein